MNSTPSHDEYAAYLGECECCLCRPSTREEDVREEWEAMIEAIEWGGQ